MEVVDGPASPAEVLDAFAAEGYLADTGLATAVLLAMRMPRPLLLEGEPGVGKTAVAQVLSRWTGGELIRLQCYEGIDAGQALYEWDHARQLLHLRAAEAVGPGPGAGADALESSLYAERFLVRRPLLRAISAEAGTGPRPVLLIDELDRADDEFEAFLLELLSDWSVSIPELGTIRATVPPLTVITSNRTRDLHDALKRRCLYHWLDHPDPDRELAIIRLQVPAIDERLAAQVAAATARLRSMHLYKPPGVAEAIDWATALAVLGADRLDAGTVASTLGLVVKHHEDEERVRSVGLDVLVEP